MFKKSILLAVLAVNLIFINTVQAKAKECLVKPSYNIVISNEDVQFINQNTLDIKPDGTVILNGQLVKTKPLIKKEAKEFQEYVRKELPLYETLANTQLDDVNAAFEKAIRENLGDKSSLLNNLASLHSQLIALLHKSIITTDGVTYFYYQPFNNLKKDGEAISEKVFYQILGSSILNFDIFKNYSAIKKIAKNQWKSEKVVLQSFDDYVCELMGNIDDQYNHLMIGLQ
ncbi:hypothetical protein [Orbus mooreae]|uniref:hypothetical protein n=1 Tax=Orbus mooreae TaxID=3074107 RepID=UPI00370D11EC